jgi:hypothetical protein
MQGELLMASSIKWAFGVLALVLIALLAVGIRGENHAQAQSSPSQAKAAEPSQEQGVKEMQTDPCQGMMQQMSRGPAMGMMGIQRGMEMGGMGMMPMMHEHMMMRMMMRNPKIAGKMMQMRADMMRAVADVMTKYGKEMESGQWPSAQGEGGD